jgi:signal peptidase I
MSPSSIAPSPAVTPPIETDPAEEKRLRVRARRRAMYCPGAGWALLGYGTRGTLVFATFAIGFSALIWMLWTLSPASLWAAGATMLVAVVLWVVEALDVGWCRTRPDRGSWLVRRFAIATFTMVVMVLALPLVLLLRFGSIAIFDDRMAPTIESGERLIFHRGIADRDLHEGAVVVYRVSAETKVGMPGELTVARILAVPGDELAIQRKHFLVNGEVSRYRAVDVPPKAPVKISERPKSLTVPEDCYFVVLDSSSADIDGQQIGWLHRGDLVSTRLFHFGAHGVLTPVK